MDPQATYVFSRLAKGKEAALGALQFYHQFLLDAL